MIREPKAWFCVRTQPKHEHIAAAHLRTEGDIEVYLPRMRFKRATREGAAWTTEAMFPGYLFARFALTTSARRVHHTRGVQSIVHFGSHWPVIPDGVVKDLRAQMGADQVHVVSDEVEPGDGVVIAGGAFHNLRAVVARVMPSRDRVAVLLEFLGRQTTAELDRGSLVRDLSTVPA